MAAEFSVSIKLPDPSKIQEALRKVGGLTSDRFQELANVTVERAKENSPYLTGHNASTITYDQESKGDAHLIVWRVYTQSGYGGYLELLHKTKSAYIRRAFEAAWREIEPKLNGAV